MIENINQIAASPDWWAEIRFTGETEIAARLPVVFWVFTTEGSISGVCFDDGVTPFLAESDDDIQVRYRYGKTLEQIGIGIPEKP